MDASPFLCGWGVFCRARFHQSTSRVLLVWASYWHPKPREDLVPNQLGEWAFDDDVVDGLEGLVA